MFRMAAINFRWRGVALGAVVILGGCSNLPPVTPEQRAWAKEDNPLIGPHPNGVRATFPPADPSSAQLRCVINGQDTICSRSGS